MTGGSMGERIKSRSERRMKRPVMHSTQRRTPQARLTLLCVVALLATTGLASAEADHGTRVAADNPNILYTGRIDRTDPKAPKMWWPGSQVTACFEGGSVAAILDDHGDNYFYAIVDDGPPALIDLTPGLSTYSIAEGLSDETHTVTLFKRTETAEGETTFRGFVLDRGHALSPSPPRPARRIEFYGDSITSGHSVASATGDSNAADAKDNYFAYSGVAARDLDAEYHCISVSGIGLYVDTWGFGGDMQSLYYDRLGPSKRWDFARWVPDVVVVNLGQNDAWGPHTPRGVTENYVRFARTLRGHYPRAHLILALGSMQATSHESPWPSYLTEAVDILRSEHQDRDVHALIFPYSGDPHPSRDRQAAMAKQLSEFIRTHVPAFRSPAGTRASR